MPGSYEQKKKQNRQMGITFAVVVVAAMIIFSGGAFLFTRAFTGHIATPADYETMSLTASSYSDKVSATGSIQAAASVTISPEVDGIVESVSVKEGDVVVKGDVLFIMKSDSISEAANTAGKEYTAAKTAKSDAQTKVDKANDVLKSAKQSLSKAQKNLDKAEAKNKAAEEAAEAEAPEGEEGDSAAPAATLIDLTPYEDAVEIATSSVENAQENLDSAKEALNAAKTKLDSAKDTYKKARAELDKLTIEAPNDGTVVNLKVEEGQGIVAKSITDGVMNIVDTSTITCVVQVSEAQISNIVKGQSAVVKCEAAGDKEISATVSRIADVPSDAVQEEEPSSEGGATMSDPSQSGSTYYDVVLTLGKTGGGAKVGMTATADIHVRDFGTVYYVPATAVASNQAGMYVEAVIDSSTTKQYSVSQLAKTEDGQLVIQGASLVEGMNIRTDLSAGV